MPRVSLAQTNFTAGELSPRLFGRVDVARYANAAEEMVNCYPVVHGGTLRRPGTVFERAQPIENRVSRLVPFVFSRTVSYVLEFAHLTLNVYQAGAVLYGPGGSKGASIVTPYTEAMLRELAYVQAADTMFIAQAATRVHRLVRTAGDTFTLQVVPWVVEPFAEINASPAVTLTPSAASPVGAVVTMTAGGAAFAAGDVGKWLRINGGLAQITAFTSATQVSARIVKALTGTVAAPADAWSLEEPVWSASRGYPQAVCLHEQRLILAGTSAQPQTIWGSVVGEYLNFTLGADDADAFAFTVASDQVNPIQHVASNRALVALTFGGEFTVQGGIEKPIAPTNVRIQAQSSYGCAPVRPTRVGNEMLFVHRSGRRLRAMSYRVDQDVFAAPDLAVLAEHVLSPGVVDMAYQQEPDSLVWLVRSDGVLVSLTFDRDQDVIGFARHVTDGAFESVAVIPVGTAEQVWVTVRRTINGVTRRFVERFDPLVRTDASVRVVGAGGPTSPALSWLQAKNVAAVLDGSFVGQFTVPASPFEIALPRAWDAEAFFGLPFVPRVAMLTPEIGTGTGTAQGNSMRIGEVTLRFLDTVGCTVNGDRLPMRQFGEDVLDHPPGAVTGLRRVSVLGWLRGEARLVVEQPDPMPFHLLSVVRKLTVND